MPELHYWSDHAMGLLGLVFGVYITLWAFHLVSLKIPDTSQTRHLRKAFLFIGPFEIVYGLWQLFH